MRPGQIPTTVEVPPECMNVRNAMDTLVGDLTQALTITGPGVPIIQKLTATSYTVMYPKVSISILSLFHPLLASPFFSLPTPLTFSPRRWRTYDWVKNQSINGLTMGVCKDVSGDDQVNWYHLSIRLCRCKKNYIAIWFRHRFLTTTTPPPPPPFNISFQYHYILPLQHQ